MLKNWAKYPISPPKTLPTFILQGIHRRISAVNVGPVLRMAARPSTLSCGGRRPPHPSPTRFHTNQLPGD